MVSGDLQAQGIDSLAGPVGGPCKVGKQACINGSSVCSQTVFPSSEICNDKDDDCDGTTDESLLKSCYTGAAGTHVPDDVWERLMELGELAGVEISR